MQEWLTRHGTHIEIGSGPGSVLDVMRRQNYSVDGLDIRDTSFRQDLRPVLYEGEVIEDVYEGRVMEWLTKRFDSLMNLEFKGHPHSNRTDKDWLASFEQLGLTLRHRTVYRVAGVFKQAVYVLEAKL